MNSCCSNRDGFTMDNGEKNSVPRQFYLEQSVGYWNVVGEVTSWVLSKA